MDQEMIPIHRTRGDRMMSLMTAAAPTRELCFVAMPFGTKNDAAGPVVFDAVYKQIIAPAIEAAGLESLRADEEMSGGIIHKPMFERLILVNGIGPKLALVVLSGIDALDLVRAIERNDVARLVVIPGVGKKTAERICVELRDRLPKDLDRATGETTATPANAMRDDLVSALSNLGYHRQTIDKVIDQLFDSAKEQRFEDLLRGALKQLSRS